MTTRRTLFAAALLLMGAALWTSCQKEAGSVRDEVPADVPEGCLWLSLEASKAADTKALALDGSTLNAYWEAGEKVEVFLDGTCIGTLYAAPNGTDPTKATLSGTVNASGIAENAVLTLLFPRDSWDYAGQAGTLASIAGTYDYAAAEVEVVSVDGTNVTTTRASFVNRQSIYKLTFTGLLAGIASVTIHSAGNKLVASSEVGGSQTYGDVTVTLDDDARTANGEGVVYAALRFDALEAGQTDVLTITITDTGSNTYVATKFSPSGGFQNGKYYTTTKAVQEQRRIILDEVTETYVAAKDGDIITGSFEGYITVPDGATVTLDNASIGAPNYSDHAAIHCLGSAHIILNGVNNAGAGSYSNYPAVLAAHNDSGIGEEYTLTISGTGSLSADSPNNSAGIGGGNGIPCGNIVITGGTIDATSIAYYSAGIGSVQNSSCGNITISGGTVTATGGYYSAGIGCGYADGSISSCGNITISGGRVEASGGSGGAGIGSGRAQGSGISSCGDITISGGEVIATGAGAAQTPQSAAGIGSGHAMSSSTSSCGDITISGGTVTATGSSNAAGIGCGYAQSMGSISSCEDITISGGNITATGGNYGAGIGSGYSYSTSRNSCGTITISGGEVTATGGSGGAGIGSGRAQRTGTSYCGDITISGGSIGSKDDYPGDYGACGGQEAAGIGSGYKGSCGNITITKDIDFLHAVKDDNYENVCIIGYGYSGTCGTVTIADVVMDDNQMKYGDNDPIGGLYSSADGSEWELSKDPF